jgi:hypothetical protein
MSRERQPKLSAHAHSHWIRFSDLGLFAELSVVTQCRVIPSHSRGSKFARISPSMQVGDKAIHEFVVAEPGDTSAGGLVVRQAGLDLPCFSQGVD